MIYIFNSVTYQILQYAYKKLTRIVSDNDDIDEEEIFKKKKKSISDWE